MQLLYLNLTEIYLVDISQFSAWQIFKIRFVFFIIIAYWPIISMAFNSHGRKWIFVPNSMRIDNHPSLEQNSRLAYQEKA